jgi:hypothetical protein
MDNTTLIIFAKIAAIAGVGWLIITNNPIAYALGVISALVISPIILKIYIMITNKKEQTGI